MRSLVGVADSPATLPPGDRVSASRKEAQRGDQKDDSPLPCQDMRLNQTTRQVQPLCAGSSPGSLSGIGSASQKRKTGKLDDARQEGNTCSCMQAVRDRKHSDYDNQGSSHRHDDGGMRWQGVSSRTEEAVESVDHPTAENEQRAEGPVPVAPTKATMWEKDPEQSRQPGYGYHPVECRSSVYPIGHRRLRNAKGHLLTQVTGSRARPPAM